MSLRNPHDTFFRQIFGQPEVAADFLDNYLPDAVRAQLDLSTVELQPDSFLDDNLREHFADLLFRVQLHSGDIAFVYALFEHKSQPEPLVAFQLLRYMVRIWERTQRDEGTLPLIIPIVVYHGEQPWRVPQKFGALFTGSEALRPYWPDFTYSLHDLSEQSDEELRGEVVLRVALLALKTIFAPDAAVRLPRIILLLYRGLTDEQRALEYLRTVLLYLSTSSHLEPEDVRTAIKTALSNEEEGVMMTLAEKWIAEYSPEIYQQRLEEGLKQGIEQGVAQGVEQGREQGQEEMVLNQLAHRFGPPGSALVQQIRDCSSAQLLGLGNLLLDVTSLEQVEQYLENELR